MNRVGIETSSDVLSVARYVKALHAAGNVPDFAESYAEGQRAVWHTSPGVYRILKTAVGGNNTTDAAALAYAQGLFREFIGLIRPRTLVDRIAGWRRVPQNVSVLRYSSDATASVVAEGASIPVSKFSLERTTLDVQKVAALIVVTKEALNNSSDLAEISLASELAKAVGLGTDRAMFDVNTVGSIANSGTILVSAGSTLANIDADLLRMFAYFNSADSALDSAVFTMSATTAAYLGSLRGTGGANAFPNIGARGGSLLGVPVFVSGAMEYAGSPSNRSIVLFDPSQVLLADPNAIEIATSESTTIQQDTAPTEHSVTPTATQAVSMFQANCVAIAARRWINWTLASTTACVTLNNVAY